MQTTTSARQGKSDAATTLLSVVLDREAREPLGRQLYLRIRDLILSGQLEAGAKMPSSRKLADDLAVSRTVTLTAYEQLAGEGYLAAQHGSGHYVRTLNRAPPSPPRTKPVPRLPDQAAIAPRGRPFDSDAPATALFPIRAWARVTARGWRREGEAAVGFDHWAGLPSLRSAIAGHLRALQGLDCTAEHVLVTGGTGDALQVITRALGAKGAQIWVEDPGHIGGRRALAREGLDVVPVPVDAEGLNVVAGRRLAPRARFALVTPSRQFPSGAPLSLPRRVALIDWAMETGAIILADDYDSELRFAGRPMETLSSLDRSGCVLAIGGFSKVTFPGLRLGYVVGAPALIACLAEARARDGVPVPTGAQPALAEFIAGGHMAKHLRTLRQKMGQRRQVLAAALEARLGDLVTVAPQEVGTHLSITLNRPLEYWPSDAAFATFAAEHGLDLDPLSTHEGVTRGRQGFVLGYAAWDESVLVAAVERLADLLSAKPAGN